jgi:hypothetical protein
MTLADGPQIGQHLNQARGGHTTAVFKTAVMTWFLSRAYS